MLDFNAPEFLVVAIVALIVIGPKDLPKALRLLGKWVGKARGVARQFRSGFDNMIRESELAEMEAKWKAENERIMREHPMQALSSPQQLLGAPADASVDDHGPVMTAMPDIRPEPVAPVVVEAAAPKPRKRKAPTTGDALEAPKPEPKPRKPRAKAQS
jgi:sec-independent protein translocase protein TatB